MSKRYIRATLKRFFSFFGALNSVGDPELTVKRINGAKKICAVVGALLAILIIVILLLHSCQERDLPYDSVDIPGNVIDNPSEKAELEFYNTSDEENLPFNAKGMDGGYTETVIYRVIATYNSDFVLKYDMSIRDEQEFQMLAEVLKIKVELVGGEDDLLYNGLISEMEALEIPLSSEQTVTEELLFKITVYLDEPLKEKYYGQKLAADMSFWIEEQDRISVANNEFSTVSPAAPPVATPDLSFFKINAQDNTPFYMQDIIEGAAQSKYFAFELTHGEDVEMLLDKSVISESGLFNLIEKLKVKAELVGENGNVTLYEGPFEDFKAEHKVLKNENGKTTLYYKITVTVEGFNPLYYEKELICDLSFSVKGTTEKLKVTDNTFEAYKNESPSTPEPPPSEPETATSIELTAKNGYDNIPFDVKNMLPGDSVEQYYCVSVTHEGDETVQFAISVNTAQKLSNVLRVKVEQLIPNGQDKVLYDDLMKDCNGIDVSVTTSAETVTPIYYRITAYTNGAEVGNEYAGETLSADFSWQLK